ncbi:hypothetical protein ATW60_11930 [Oenococcus oeni]|nr:hypothetical protein ATW60_11930 [Oenococcus oeni]
MAEKLINPAVKFLGQRRITILLLMNITKNSLKCLMKQSLLNQEGVDQYSFTSLVALGLIEEDSKVETLKQRVTELENEIKTLKAA